MTSKIPAICFLALALSVLVLGTYIIVGATIAANSTKPAFEPIIDTAFPFYLVSISLTLGFTGIFALIGRRLWPHNAD